MHNNHICPWQGATDSRTVVMQKLIAIINALGNDDYLANYRKYIPSGGNQMVKPFRITASAYGGAVAGTVQLASKGTDLEVRGTGLVKASIAARMMADPGIIFKANDTRIEAETGAHIIAEGTEAHQIVITSLFDNRFGASGSYVTGTNNQNPNYLPQGGDWGGGFSREDGAGWAGGGFSEVGDAA